MKNKNRIPSVPKGNSIVKRAEDLSIFKTIEGNRPINPAHVMRLSRSMEQNGMLVSPIIVNDNMEVIDGQHRLAAAKASGFDVYYIQADNYDLQEVHTLNINQKNWTAKDYLEGYCEMGLKDYILLREFYLENKEFGLGLCTAMTSSALHGTGLKAREKAQSRGGGISNQAQVFSEGTWKINDVEKARDIANKMRAIQPYYDGYYRKGFVSAMIQLLKNESFNFGEFLGKLRQQPTSLQHCSNRTLYTSLIEEIYNFKRRAKVNLRYS